MNRRSRLQTLGQSVAKLIERMILADLRTRIAALSYKHAIKVAAFVTQFMQDELRQRQDMPAELLGTGLTDDEAVNLLGNAFPEFSTAFDQARSTAAIDERGKIARNLLLILAEETRYAETIEKGIDQLQFVADPITWMAVGAGIVFLLSIKFNVTSKMVDGKRRVEWEVSRDATPIEVVMKLLDIVPLSRKSGASPQSNEVESKPDTSIR